MRASTGGRRGVAHPARMCRARSGPSCSKNIAAIAWLRPSQGPDDPTGVVADDPHQVPVALAVGDLIDADAAQAIQAIAGSHDGELTDDALHHATHAGPVDAHQLSNDALGRSFGQIHAAVLERSGEPGSRPSPRHLLGSDAALWALDSPDLAAQHQASAGQTEMPPGLDPPVIGDPRTPGTPGTEQRPLRGQADIDDQGLASVDLSELEPHNPLAIKPQQALE